MNIRPIGIGFLILAACGSGPNESPLPLLEASPAALDFDTVGLGSTASSDFSLKNSGGGEINILSISLIEGDAGVWDLETPTTTTLGEGESIFVTVLFSPRRQEDYQGRVQVRSDDVDNSSLYITLKGLGGPSTLDEDNDGYAEADGDCDDEDPQRHPAAAEACDGVDNNCDGVIPTQESDDDYDGYRLCATETLAADCDDDDAQVYPDAPEICDDKDSDCDGLNADHADSDGDGQSICDGCEGQNGSADCGDCNDADPQMMVDLPETCDGKDNDCDGLVDNQDADGDGFSLCDTGGDCDDSDADIHPLLVDANASALNADGTALNPYPTLGEAIAAYDESMLCPILVLDGEYTGPFTISSNQRIAIQGQSQDGTRLVGDEGIAIFDVRSQGALTLESLTLEGGNHQSDGGAISGGTDASIHLKSILLQNNSSDTDGGAISIVSGELTLEDCELQGNQANDDGGAIAATSAKLSIHNTRFAQNTATFGGSIFAVSGTDLSVEASQFDGNEARDSGGAIWLEGSDALSIAQNTFFLNAASDAGGAVVLGEVDAPQGYFANNILQDNESQGNGGALVLEGSQTTRLQIHNNTFTSNIAQGGGNTQGLGASLLIRADAQDLDIQGNIFAWARGFDNIHSTDIGGELAYNTVFNTSSGQEFGGVWADDNLTLGQSDEHENFNDNPLFTQFSDDASPGDDLRLRGDSPCIDSGPPSDSFLDADGSRNDRGAFGGCLAFDGSGSLEICGG